MACTYDEVLHVKWSAAKFATKELSVPDIIDASAGLVQVIVYNLDAEISSQNGQIPSHSLAILVIQPMIESDAELWKHKTISRISKDEMTEPIEYGNTIYILVLRSQ